MSSTTKTQRAISSDALLRQLSWRYATKKFDAARKISTDDWATLEQALILAPSSYGIQPWKFIVVDDAATRTKLRAAAWNQSQVTDASHLVVFAIKKNVGAADIERFAKRMLEVRQVPAASIEGYKQHMLDAFTKPRPGFDANVWSARQTYIALGFFLSAAALLDIDACPMEGFDPAQFDEILGLSKQGYGAVVVAAAGYRAPDDGYARYAKVRFDAKDVVQYV